MCNEYIDDVSPSELEQSKKQSEQDKKAIDELVRERDILNKNMLKAAWNTQKHFKN